MVQNITEAEKTTKSLEALIFKVWLADGDYSAKKTTVWKTGTKDSGLVCIRISDREKKTYISVKNISKIFDGAHCHR